MAATHISRSRDFFIVKRLVNFKIVVGDGKVIGTKVLLDHVRKTYYDIC
jgi:hypothetical protein